MSKPVVTLTMGDAAGVGPEIIVKALCLEPACYEWINPVVVGDKKRLEEAMAVCGLTGKAVIKTVDENSLYDVDYKYGEIACLDMDLLPANLPFGQLSAAAGDAAFKYLIKAIDLCMKHKADSICTAPLNKEAMHMGGHKYPGHTEILAEYSNTEKFSMMFMAPEMDVILVTIHVGLIESVAMCTPEKIFDTISICHEVECWRGLENPKIAVCGINPHAGEHGLFGNREEENQVQPACDKARALGWAVDGPLPPDTAFMLAKRGDYDAVVAMNHDQGLGPIKVLDINKAVNVSVGLPFVRTSVDHGTAFNIAGTGTANHTNMIEAIRQAGVLTSGFNKAHGKA